MAKVIASRWSSRLWVAAPRRVAPPSMRRSSPSTSIRAPSAVRPVGHPADPVALLVAQLAGAADRGRAPGLAGGQAQDRDLVDGLGHVGRPEVDAVQLGASARRGRPAARRRPRRSARRPRRRRIGCSSMSAPIRRRMSMTARRVGLTPTARSIEFGVRMDRPGDQPEGGRRHVAGHPLIPRLHRRPSLYRPDGLAVGSVLALDRDAAGAEHPFRVVACRDPFADRRPPLRPEPRQQDRRLHLGRWHGCRVVDGPERGVADHGQGREGVVVSRVERRAHPTQRFDDTSDRSPTQRIVAGQDARHGQPGEHPGEQPEARPGVPAVEDVGRLGQAVGARRDDPIVDRPAVLGDPFDGRAQGAQDARRRAHVGAVAGGRDATLAGGHRREQQGAMADRLVAGQAHLAAQARGRPDGGDGVAHARGTQCLLSPAGADAVERRRPVLGIAMQARGRARGPRSGSP